MKQSELRVGGVYTNGKQRETIRRVLRFTNDYLYFKTIKGFGGYDQFAVLKSSFARWAKSEVKEAKNG